MKADPAERRRVLLQIMDGEESTRLTLEKAITEMDYGNKKTITFKNLETAVSKIVRNVNYNDLSNYASNFKYTADTISYQRLLEDYNDFKKKRNEYLDILDTIYRKLSNAGTGLLELLEDSDPKRTRYLDKYVFKHVIENIGVNNFKLDDQSFMDFVPSTEKGIDYTSFYDDFCAFIRKIGKNPDDLKKDAYMRDPKNYWAREIFEAAHNYFTKNKMSPEDFFKSHGMDTDTKTINPSSYMVAIDTLVPKIDKTLLYKLENELLDDTKSISIAKFTKIYNVLLQGGGIESPDKVDDRLFNQLVSDIVKKILDKCPSIEDFFSKFEYSKFGAVMDQDKFENALATIGHYLVPEERRLLQKKIAVGSQKFDIKIFLEYKIETKGVKGLEKDQKIKFEKLYDEIKAAVEKDKIDLFREFKNESPISEDHISLGEFTKVFKKNDFNFRDDEIKILSLPFINPNKNNLINYRQFCDGLAPKKSGFGIKKGREDDYVSQHVLEDKTRDIYKEIRHQYGSIEEFFRKFDSGNNYLTNKDFSKAMSELGIHFEYNQLEKLFEKFDRSGSGRIVFAAFTRAMEDYVDSDLRILLDKICSALNQKSQSFDEFIRKHMKTSYSLRIFDFKSALAESGINLKIEDMSFLLEGIGCKPDRDNMMELDDLKAKLQTSCEKLNVGDKSSLRYIFSSGNSGSGFSPESKKPSENQSISMGLMKKQNRFNIDTRTKSPEDEPPAPGKIQLMKSKGSKFTTYKNEDDEPENNPMKRATASSWGNNNRDDPDDPARDARRGWGRDDPNKFDGERRYEWAKDFFIDIHECLEKKGKKFYEYFRDNKMDVIDMKRSLSSLGVNVTSKYADLLEEFKDRYYFDLDKFERVFNDFKDDFEIQNRKRPNDLYAEVRECLRNSRKSFDQVFEKGRMQGYLETYEFKNILTGDLRCYLSQTILDDILFDLKEKGMISLSRLKKNLNLVNDDDKIDEKYFLEKFKAKMKEERLDIIAIMNILKISDAQYISYENFSRIFDRILPEMTKQEVGKLFRFFDKNGDGRISRNEFIRTMEEKNEKADKILMELKDLIRRTKSNIEKSFDLFDRNRRGYLDFDQFYDVISHLNDRLSRTDVEYLFRKFDETSSGKVSKGSFLRILYDEHSTPFDPDRAKNLYNKLKQKLSTVDEIQITKLLKHADPDHTGSITPDNFQNFVMNIDRDLNFTEVKMIFRMLDDGGKGYLKYDDFLKDVMRYQNIEAPANLDPEVLSEVAWTSDYFEEMAYILKVCDIEFNDYFYSNERFKDDFNKKFDYLDIVMSSSEKARFLETFQDKYDPKRLDLKKMNECFNYFAKNRKNSDEDIKKIHINHIVRDMTQGLKFLGKNIEDLLTEHDRFQRGTIKQDAFEQILKDLQIRNSVNRKIIIPHVQGSDGQVSIIKVKELFKTAGSVPEDVKALLARNTIAEVRKTISVSGIDPEIVFDKFDRDKNGTINQEEFADGLHMFDRDLRPDHINAVFVTLDKDKKGSITKYRFLKTFGNVQNNELPMFLLNSPARDFFQRVHDIKAKHRLDLYNVLKVQGGNFSRATLNYFSLYDLDTSKFSQEIELICEIIGDEREGFLSFDLFSRCVDRAYEPVYVKFVKRDLTEAEMKRVDAFFAELSKSIQRDTLKYEDIFHFSKEPDFISQDDYNKIIYNIIARDPYSESDLAADYLKNIEGKIQFSLLKEKLGFVAEKKSELTEFIANLKKKYHDTTQILSIFDKNHDQTVSIREFRKACWETLNLKNDEVDQLFHLIAKGADEIKTMDLKNLLEEDLTINKKLVRDLCIFIFDRQRAVLNQFKNFDNKNQKKLSIKNIKMALTYLEKQVTEADIEILMKYLRIPQETDGSYNYYNIIDAISERDITAEDKRDFERALARLKDEVLEKAIDLADGVKRLDTDGSMRIPFKKIEEYFLHYSIIIRADEKEMILNYFHVHDEEARVGAKEFCDLIYNGLEDDSPNAFLLQQAQYIKKLVFDIKTKMRESSSRNQSVYDIVLGSDSYVPSKVFETKMQPYISTDDLISSINLKNIKDQELVKRLQDSTEFRILCRLCMDEGRGDMVNLNQVDVILRDIDKYRGKMSLQDAEFLDSTYNNIRRFIFEDKLNVEDLINSCKPVKQAIERRNFLIMLVDKIKIPPNEKLIKFVRMICDERGFIEVEDLKRNLLTNNYSQSSLPTQQTPRDKFFDPKANAQTPSFADKKENFNYNQKIDLTESKIISNSALQPTTSQQGKLNHLDTKDPMKSSSSHIGGKIFQGAPNDTGKSNFGNNQNIPSIANLDKKQSKVPDYKFTKDYSGKLEEDILEVFNKRGTPNLERFLFFDDKVEGTVNIEKFATKVRQLVNKVPDNDILALFKTMDKNKSGLVNEPEFRIFMDDSSKGTTKSSISSLPDDMVRDIEELFRKMDTNGDQTIDLDEMHRMFLQLGSHQSREETEEIFKKYDTDGSKTISKQEFFAVMTEKIKNDLLNIESIVARLRDEFRKADLTKSRELTYDQTLQALINLGVDLKPEEAKELLEAIDRDKSGKIDIDEFIQFIMSPPDSNSLSSEADIAIISIKRANKKNESLIDMLSKFDKMPFNFITSFTRDLMKKGDLLPSSSFKPKTDISGSIYLDLKLADDKVVVDPKSKASKKIQNTESSIQPIQSNLAATITLKLATGIPIPTDSGNKRQDIAGRELRVCLFNGRNYVGNIVRVPVDWKIEYEDRWYFLPNKIANENCVVVRLANYNEKTDVSLVLVFEFVLLYKNNNEIIEMSNGWTSIPVASLNVTKSHELLLNGGSPTKSILIIQEDVIANRTGWRKVVKNLSKPIVSKLTIEVDSKDKMKKEEVSEIEYLPATCIINKNSIPLIKTFRNYLGKVFKDGLDFGVAPDLLSDVKTKLFLKAVDCPDVYPILVKFWNQNVVNAKNKNVDYTSDVEILKLILNNLYLLFNCSDFQFNEVDPAVIVDENLANIRMNIANYYIYQGIEEKLPQIKKPFTTFATMGQKINYKPFSIDELIVDDDNDTHMEFVANLKNNFK